MRSVLGLVVLFGVGLVGCAGQGQSPLSQQPTTGRLQPPGSGGAGSAAGSAVAAVEPVGKTSAVPSDADDPAIWIHPTDPAKSLILGNDKEEGTGGLYVWDLSGKEVAKVTPIDRPNNVDVEYGFELDGKTVDLAVLTERIQSRLRIFAIDRETGTLTDVSGSTGFLGEQEGEMKSPMGIGLYRRPKDGTVYAIVSPKEGPLEGYMAQYRLVANGGKIDTKLVRRFGKFGGLKPDAEGEMSGEVEAVLVDDEAGFVYYSDEMTGIRKYHADPDAPEAGKELALFGTDQYQGDREGLALVPREGGEGYLLSVDQIEGGSMIHIYNRKPVEGAVPHRRLGKVLTRSDETDGMEVTTVTLKASAKGGMVVMMNSRDRNFLMYSLESILSAAGLK